MRIIKEIFSIPCRKSHLLKIASSLTLVLAPADWLVYSLPMFLRSVHLIFLRRCCAYAAKNLLPAGYPTGRWLWQTTVNCLLTTIRLIWPFQVGGGVILQFGIRIRGVQSWKK